MAHRHPSIAGARISKHSNRVRRALCVALPVVLGAAALGACAQGSGAMDGSTITEISIERDCSGCSEGSRLVLRRDGTATLLQIGKARLGTQDRRSRSTLRREDFDALARQVEASGFFALQELYEDPALQDGAWVATQVVRGARDKRIVRRDAAGPAPLKQLEAAIAAVQARLVFTPDGR